MNLSSFSLIVYFAITFIGMAWGASIGMFAMVIAMGPGMIGLIGVIAWSYANDNDMQSQIGYSRAARARIHKRIQAL